MVRQDLILNAGATVTVNVQLGLAQVAEVITVSGESPVVDVRETGIPQSFDRARLENIPSARDPWVVIEQTPGMVMDRQNVGGNESGQQSTFVTRGTSFTQNIWNYDGVNITAGLPVVRVSVDHGTAFDIAGKGIAREASLVLALRRAAELAPGWGHVWRATNPGA